MSLISLAVSVLAGKEFQMLLGEKLLLLSSDCSSYLTNM